MGSQHASRRAFRSASFLRHGLAVPLRNLCLLCGRRIRKRLIKDSRVVASREEEEKAEWNGRRKKEEAHDCALRRSPRNSASSCFVLVFATSVTVLRAVSSASRVFLFSGPHVDVPLAANLHVKRHVKAS